MSNGFHTPAVVSLFEKQSRLVFQRMARQVGKLLKSASADNVHKFRTHSRRVEALVSELAPQNGNQKKFERSQSSRRHRNGRSAPSATGTRPDTHGRSAAALSTSATSAARATAASTLPAAS